MPEPSGSRARTGEVDGSNYYGDGSHVSWHATADGFAWRAVVPGQKSLSGRASTPQVAQIEAVAARDRLMGAEARP